jgi:hypothetical protein
MASAGGAEPHVGTALAPWAESSVRHPTYEKILANVDSLFGPQSAWIYRNELLWTITLYCNMLCVFYPLFLSLFFISRTHRRTACQYIKKMKRTNIVHLGLLQTGLFLSLFSNGMLCKLNSKTDISGVPFLKLEVCKRYFHNKLLVYSFSINLVEFEIVWLWPHIKWHL